MTAKLYWVTVRLANGAEFAGAMTGTSPGAVRREVRARANRRDIARIDVEPLR